MLITTYRAGIDRSGENVLMVNGHATRLSNSHPVTVDVAPFTPSEYFDVVIPIDAAGDYMSLTDNGITYFYFLSAVGEFPTVGSDDATPTKTSIRMHAEIDLAHTLQITNPDIWQFFGASVLERSHYMITANISGKPSPVLPYDTVSYTPKAHLRTPDATGRYDILVKCSTTISDIVQPLTSINDVIRWVKISAPGFGWDDAVWYANEIPTMNTLEFPEDPEDPETDYEHFQMKVMDIYLVPHEYIPSSWDSHTEPARLSQSLWVAGLHTKTYATIYVGVSCFNSTPEPRYTPIQLPRRTACAVGNPMKKIPIPAYVGYSYAYTIVRLDRTNNSFSILLNVNGDNYDFTESAKVAFENVDASALSDRNMSRLFGTAAVAGGLLAAGAGPMKVNHTGAAGVGERLAGRASRLAGVGVASLPTLMNNNFEPATYTSAGGAYTAQSEIFNMSEFVSPVDKTIVHSILYLYYGENTPDSVLDVELCGASGSYTINNLVLRNDSPDLFTYYRGVVHPRVKIDASNRSLSRLASLYEGWIKQRVADGVRVWSNASKYLTTTERTPPTP